ncbi:AP-1 complex subunit sigma-1-like [Rhodamnia argentea]|uniref:AP complex subunit sigma n=1 Tax=Rhodamnia argentea TaxID=178133 RepID=A0ABM3HVL6_9MYRT|nr:AP-1 complex subunit sigma-1-like [Rhodamnia argentea]
MGALKCEQIHFVLIINRQRKLRLSKWYSPYSQKERTKVIGEISGLVLRRGPEMCSFLEWGALTVVYKSYGNLLYIMCIDPDDNELEALELIDHYVRNLDRQCGIACEWMLTFYFAWAYQVLDELVIAGQIQETSIKTVVGLVRAQDHLEWAAREETHSISSKILGTDTIDILDL